MSAEVIRTERLVLRPAVASDLEPLHAIFSDPEAMQYWDRPAYDDIALTQRFLDGFMCSDPERKFEFILDLDGVCIGKAGMWDKPEIGYIIAPNQWRKGFAFEAMAAIKPLIFERFPDLEAITAELDPRNIGSVRLLDKLGFERVGFAEKNFRWGDEWTDTAYYRCERN